MAKEVFYAKRGLCMGNKYFDHRNLHKVYKGGKGARQSGGKERDRSGAGKKGYTAICAGCKGSERRGLSDHNFVLRKFRSVQKWIKRIEVVVGARIRSEEDMLGLLSGRE